MRMVLLVAIAAIWMAESSCAETSNFDKDKTGAVPEGWVAGVTGKGEPKWTVEADDSAPSKSNVLKQSGDGTYPYCVKKSVQLEDGFVEVKFKPVAGKEDQAGGLVWRWKDGDNYYVARANALENNVSIYHTIKGARILFKTAEIAVSKNEWHTIRVTFKGKAFKVAFDGKNVIEAEDENIKGAGAVGVWTKADSVTLFDDFSCAKE